MLKVCWVEYAESVLRRRCRKFAGLKISVNIVGVESLLIILACEGGDFYPREMSNSMPPLGVIGPEPALC